MRKNKGFTLFEMVFQAACRKTEKKISTNAIRVISEILLQFRFISRFFHGGDDPSKPGV